MLTFSFPFHEVTDEYPTNSVNLRFGSGYSYASKPKGPPQLTFHLSFDTMFWWLTESGTLHRTFSPAGAAGLNYAALVDFYELHQLYEYFTYVHPVRGSQTVRFAKPIMTPKGVRGGVVYSIDNTVGPAVPMQGQQLEAFTIDLIAQP